MEAGLLSRICRNPSRLRTSLYADDAVLFIKPIKEDINTLARLLEFFGEVIGLQCNLQKSTVVPIRCTDLDLEDNLQEFHAQCGNFLDQVPWASAHGTTPEKSGPTTFGA